MNCRWLPATLAAILSILWSTTALAQAPGGNFEVGTGVATTTGDISDRLTKGRNIDLGAGYEINETFERGHESDDHLNRADLVRRAVHRPALTGALCEACPVHWW